MLLLWLAYFVLILKLAFHTLLIKKTNHQKRIQGKHAEGQSRKDLFQIPGLQPVVLPSIKEVGVLVECVLLGGTF